MEKDFDNWNELKKLINQRENFPTFRQGEIWWTHIGLNVGFESDGKNEKYHRPVLIIKKFNKQLFLAVPLTTQIKVNPYYYKISFEKNKIERCAILSQIKMLDAKRLDRKIGKMTPKEFGVLRSKVSEMIGK